MANQQGFSLSEGGGGVEKLLAHYNREKLWHERADGTRELRYAHYHNLTQRGTVQAYNHSEIDPERTALNYNLAPEREGGQQAFIERRLGEIYVHKSALKNGLVDWVVTLPDMEQYRGREREFFSESYRALADKYGVENVVSAYVHMDEAQPHMHFAFVPVVPDYKHEQGWKLSRKGVNTCERTLKDGRVKRDTVEFSRQFHAYLDSRICKAMGFERSGVELTEEQREKRKIKKNMDSVPELREAVELLENAEARAVEAENIAKAWKQSADILRGKAQESLHEAKEARESCDALKDELDSLEASKTALEALVEAKTGELGSVSAALEQKIEEMKSVSADLQETSDRLERLRQGESNFTAEIEQLRAEVAALEARPLEPARESVWESAGTLVGGRSLGERERAAADEARRIAGELERATAAEGQCRSEIQFFLEQVPVLDREGDRAERRMSRLEAARDRLEERIRGLEQGISRIVERVRSFSPELPEAVQALVRQFEGRVMTPFELIMRRAEATSAAHSRSREAEQSERAIERGATRGR